MTEDAIVKNGREEGFEFEKGHFLLGVGKGLFW